MLIFTKSDSIETFSVLAALLLPIYCYIIPASIIWTTVMIASAIVLYHYSGEKFIWKSIDKLSNWIQERKFDKILGIVENSALRQSDFASEMLAEQKLPDSHFAKLRDDVDSAFHMIRCRFQLQYLPVSEEMTTLYWSQLLVFYTFRTAVCIGIAWRKNGIIGLRKSVPLADALIRFRNFTYDVKQIMREVEED